MPSRLTTGQVRYTDPRINQILDALVRTSEAPSRSKLVEALSVEPILKAFGTWLARRREAGATYSELHAETGLPVPDLMAWAEPETTLSADDVARHLDLIARKTGIDVQGLWSHAPDYPLGPR